MAADEPAGEPVRLTDGSYSAFLFDMDGVLTDTASTHSEAWKQSFDGFLRVWAGEHGTDFVPFDRGSDYGTYVDGKPRADGVRDFLASRGITLPEGGPDDPPDAQTVRGVGNRKNELVLKLLDERGVVVYDGSVRLVRALRAAGLTTAVVSSSANTPAVLSAGDIGDLFDVVVDGNVATSMRLPGKPAPDTFLEAARQVGTPPERAVVFEDALAGVAAGHAGGFGLVVGVDRVGQRDGLLTHGADIVVTDLAQLLP